MSKLYYLDEVTTVFGSEAGDDVDWSTEGVANNAGRQSAQYDLGDYSAAAGPRHFRWRFVAEWAATPTLDLPINLYLKLSDGTNPDNDDGVVDGPVSAENKLSNLLFLGSLVCDEAAAGIKTSKAGEVFIADRYVQAVLWNKAGAATSATASATKLYLTEMTPESV